MKISSSKSSLLTGIQTVIRALPSKSTMSIMECILISTTGGKISLTVNNIDLGIETVIDGKIEKTGVIALDAKFLSEIIRKMPDSASDITIESDSKFTTTISCEQVTVTGCPGCLACMKMKTTLKYGLMVRHAVAGSFR